MTKAEQNQLDVSSNLDAYLTDLVPIGDSLYNNIVHRKITKNPSLLVDDMCMGLIVALIVGLAVDPREPPEYPLLSHTFDIAVDSSTSDLGLLDLDLVEDIICREMTTGAGITDDLTVLVGAHTRIMVKIEQIANPNMRIIPINT